MALVRRLVEVGRAARAGSGVKVRQPLSRALVGGPGWSDLSDDLRAEIAEELNVGRLDAMGEAVVSYSVKPQFRALGQRFGSRTQQVAQAVRGLDPAVAAASLRADKQVVVAVDGEDIALGPDEVQVTETPRTGWFVATDGGLAVALDLEITPDLRAAGVARDVVRLIQQARKDTGLHISDRIQLWWRASGDTADAVRTHRDAIAEEVLASVLLESPGPPGLPPRRDDELGLEFWLSLDIPVAGTGNVFDIGNGGSV